MCGAAIVSGLLTCAVPAANSEARFVPVTVYGVDERNLASGFLDENEERRYSATQLIWCKTSTGDFATAGTLAGDFTHGIGVAHGFYDKKARRSIPSGDCHFRVLNRKGVLLEEIAIVRYKSRWQDDQAYNNGDQDLMMFEIASKPVKVDRFIPVSIYRAREYDEIVLVAYGYDIKPNFTKRKSRGLIYSNIGTRFQGAANVFITDTDSTPMSSGGVFYDTKGVFVGMMSGSESSGKDGPHEFQRHSDFNHGIRLDARFVREFEQFMKGR